MIDVSLDNPLKAGTYSLSIGAISTIGSLDYLPMVYTLFIQAAENNLEPWYKSNVGAINVEHNWEIKTID